MHSQYHCACCNKALLSSHKECPHCGSQHIKSSISVWIFCVTACLAVVLTFKLVHAYIQDHQEQPEKKTIFDALSKDQSSSIAKP